MQSFTAKATGPGPCFGIAKIAGQASDAIKGLQTPLVKWRTGTPVSFEEKRMMPLTLFGRYVDT